MLPYSPHLSKGVRDACLKPAASDLSIRRRESITGSRFLLVGLCLSLSLAACSPFEADDEDAASTGAAGQSGAASTETPSISSATDAADGTTTINGPAASGSPTAADVQAGELAAAGEPVGGPAAKPVAGSLSSTATSTGRFSLEADLPAIGLVEGEPASEARIRLAPQGGTLTETEIDVNSESPDLQVTLSSFSDDGPGASAVLRVEQPVGVAPIMPTTTNVVLTAADAAGENATLTLPVQVTPTPRPDVYLLAGQSNMVGFSGPGSKLGGAGEPDAQMADVRQLNVTGNDQTNFAAPTAFTDAGRIAVKSPRFVPATDPLHDGYNPASNSKAGTQVGPALSFARSAREVTTAEIILVPAAWSDTGFCSRETNSFEGMGWNSSQPQHGAFSGTLLHDRAIARANLAIEETGGILRGILWHQGEADSDKAVCAAAYADNLAKLAGSLRTSITADARGAEARGSGAAVPFIVGTMSRGADQRGNYSEFGDAKQQVDNAHRSVSSNIPFAGFVNNDDLVPPEYPCGEAACIHFGASAQREMGGRYFEALQQVVNR